MQFFKQSTLKALELKERTVKKADRGVKKADSSVRKADMSLAEMVSDFERDILSKAVETCKGNRSKAAKMLRISRTTLIAKLKKYNLNAS